MSDPFVCHQCGFETDDPLQLDTIRVHDQRVMPGEIEPAGECPDCGALIDCPDSEIEGHTLGAIAVVMRKRGWTVIQPEET